MDSQNRSLPTPDEIRLFPLFQNLGIENIFILKTIEQCKAIESKINNAKILGFDTESKPTFTKGEISTGPHLIQLATHENAFLFQVNQDTMAFLRPILSSSDQLKIGFGLKNDLHLFRKHAIELNGIVDLSKRFTCFGIKTQMGVKNAIALLFHLNFIKSKKISTSNWSKVHLSKEQVLYAAADAYAPVLIFEELLKLRCLSNDILLKVKTLS